ncbi:MAG TPA: MTH938/NDUFAF3 family protein, partial [Acidimicrobiales bacterium]|nr:MTH938/NDUFAF3 family protein [Acidimicrobiales bacterium]
RMMLGTSTTSSAVVCTRHQNPGQPDDWWMVTYCAKPLLRSPFAYPRGLLGALRPYRDPVRAFSLRRDEDMAMRIEHYEFGRIRINGREQHADLLLTPTRVLPGLWRREGHVLAIEDLDAVLAEQPRRLVVGTGAWGRMRPESGLEQALHQRAILMEAMPTAEAVRRINELLDLGETDWTAALHLTC